MIDATNLLDDIDVLKAMTLASGGREERHIDRIAQLEKLLADFKRTLFGMKSEKANPGQFELALEDIETAVASIQAAEESDDRQVEGKPRPRKANRGALPKNLPRIEEIVEPDSTTCTCRSTAKPKFTAAKGLTSTVPRWPPGLAEQRLSSGPSLTR